MRCYRIRVRERTSCSKYFGICDRHRLSVLLYLPHILLQTTLALIFAVQARVEDQPTSQHASTAAGSRTARPRGTSMAGIL